MYHNGHATLFDSSVAEEYSPDETLRNDAGTTEYMAPEQTYRREVGYYTDVFGWVFCSTGYSAAESCRTR